MVENCLPSRQAAEALLDWAARRNPGPWVDHSLTAARAAATIAAASGLDAEAAYVLALLHDIGRYEGPRGLHHVVAGYMLLSEKGYPRCARVCLTHSFPLPTLEAYSGGAFDCTAEELRMLEEFLAAVDYDPYDRLVQLCDSLSLPSGVCPMETRLVDVVQRHGFNARTPDKWRAFFAIKAQFDAATGGVYRLFREEIERCLFGPCGV